jgi:anaerobic ribonucleoside-triphosphate reductase
MEKRTKCQVYSRIVGYLSPLSQWNPGMKQMFKDRRFFKLDKSMNNYDKRD